MYICTGMYVCRYVCQYMPLCAYQCMHMCVCEDVREQIYPTCSGELASVEENVASRPVGSGTQRKMENGYEREGRAPAYTWAGLPRMIGV